MGYWSSYSKEWEIAQGRRIISEMEKERKEFERKSLLYRIAVQFFGTVRYYAILVVIHIQRLFDHKYREEMDHLRMEDTISIMAELVNKRV